MRRVLLYLSLCLLAAPALAQAPATPRPPPDPLFMRSFLIDCFMKTAAEGVEWGTFAPDDRPIDFDHWTERFKRIEGVDCAHIPKLIDGVPFERSGPRERSLYTLDLGRAVAKFACGTRGVIAFAWLDH